ncbi:MAG TPA: hypothetical protein VEA40_06835 [Ramlibacter sp.]|nr:hypothetical protein [Ramlibacter sp.]
MTQVRQPSLVHLRAPAGRSAARAQNFLVEWLEAVEGSASSVFEQILLLPDAGATLVHDGSTTEAPPRSVCILPPGRTTITPQGIAAVLRSLEPGERTEALNEAAYRDPDPRIDGIGTPGVARRDAGRVRVLAIDDLKAPPDNPRLKMLRSATLSINWVEYEGPRDRTKLSPHAHRNFEQGSLALAGEFVHHLRVPWTADANAWVADRHERLGSPSLLVVPVELVHTSEGVGPGRHLLVDVFSPPREDFIAKGWMLNAGDYA